MQDIKIDKTTENYFDITFKNGDIETVDNFEPALNISLFTNARASDDILIPEKRDGWIGDVVSPVEGRQLGSLLWMFYQSRLTNSTLNNIKDYCYKSLSWLVEDNNCSNITVSGSVIPKQGIQLKVDITAKTGKVETRFFNLWENTGE